MSFPKDVYRTLESIVGPENISDDPAICEGDTKGGWGEYMYDRDAVRPAVVILPGSTEQVQEIVRIANRYKLPYIPTSTYYLALCAPNKPNTIMMDMKRMQGIMIDERNMYAVCESGVSYSQLQAEALKRGLYTHVPGCGAQASVVANYACHGQGPFGYRIGYAYRRLLSVEWVLPDGELLNLGAAATGDGDFWGEGPGPDLRGLLRGTAGHMGGLGTVTRVATKLFPLIPEKLEPSGISPYTTLQLPANRAKWYNITYPTIDQAVNVMYEIGRSEIGMMVMTVPPIWRYVARARGKGANAFWEEWNKAKDVIDPEQTIVRVLLMGFTSEKQLAYEERVLQDIAAETGGVIRPGRPNDESWFMSADAISIMFIGGAEMSELSFDTVESGLKVGRDTVQLARKHMPPFGQDYGNPGWLTMYEFGHMGHVEYLAYADLDDAMELYRFGGECMQRDVKLGAYPGYQDVNVLGPAWFNFDRIMRAIKATFDPNNVSNPPKPLNYG